MRNLNQDKNEATITTSEEEIELVDNEPVTVSHRHKIRMNRVFREVVGSKFIPYPEVDNFYERARSWIVVKLNLRK